MTADKAGDKMVYGAILEKGEKYYTDLKRVFNAINNKQTEYNWLITDCVCYPSNPKISEMLSRKYCWLDGEELTDIIDQENFQWIWAVLSAFDKSVELSSVLQYPLPFADGYEGFSKTPLTMQNPLAKIEIIPWDSSLTILLSEDKSIADDFRSYFPQSEDLVDYNAKR